MHIGVICEGVDIREIAWEVATWFGWFGGNLCLDSFVRNLITGSVYRTKKFNGCNRLDHNDQIWLSMNAVS